MDLSISTLPKVVLISVIILTSMAGGTLIAQATDCEGVGYMNERLPATNMQTGQYWRPELDVRTEGIMLYAMNPRSDFVPNVKSWSEKGYVVEAMIGFNHDWNRSFANGSLDGKFRPYILQTLADGSIFEWPGTRQAAAVPTQEWIDYLCEFVSKLIESGVVNVYLEEPHYFFSAGYSDAFKQEWEKFYGEKWEDPRSSPQAWFKSGQLQAYLTYKGIEQVSRFIKENYPDVGVYVASHSHMNQSDGPYSENVPNGMISQIPYVNGLLAQVWSNTAMVPSMSGGINQSRVGPMAYLGYSYFANLAQGSGKSMRFLGDPAADGEHLGWQKFKSVYEQTLVTSLLFPDVTLFETVPWPERVFHDNSSPDEQEAHSRYKTQVAAIFQALGDMKNQKEIQVSWTEHMDGIGIAISDTMNFQRWGPEGSSINSFYGLSIPLVEAGIPVRIVPAESMTCEYLQNLNTLIMAYDAFKPPSEDMHLLLKNWVHNGGVLILIAGPDAYYDVDGWWVKAGYEYPQTHLLQMLGMNISDGDFVLFQPNDRTRFSNVRNSSLAKALGALGAAQQYGMLGLRNVDNPAYLRGNIAVAFEQRFGDGALLYLGMDSMFVAKEFIGTEFVKRLVKYSIEEIHGKKYEEPGYLRVTRGRYVAVWASSTRYVVEGTYLDLCTHDLKVVTNKVINPGEVGFLLDPQFDRNTNEPCVVFSSSQVADIVQEESRMVISLVGPEGVSNFTVLGLPVGTKEDDISVKGVGASASWSYNKELGLLFVTIDDAPNRFELEVCF